MTTNLGWATLLLREGLPGGVGLSECLVSTGVSRDGRESLGVYFRLEPSVSTKVEGKGLPS